MKLSLAITTFNRYELTVESFAQVMDDPRIDDIVILDDCSTDGSYEKLRDHFNGNEKVRVIRQAQNRGMGQNKADAVAHCKNEWVILWDSDNILAGDYLDALQKVLPNSIKHNILCPEFARPQFDYRKFSGKLFFQDNAHELVSDKMGNCLLNTCNYVVPRDFYLQVFKPNPEVKGSDTLWFNYLWLKSLKWFYIVPGMQYYHRVHSGSTWMEHAGYNMKMAEKINKQILSLCTTSKPTN